MNEPIASAEQAFDFQVAAQDGTARRGRLSTAHGTIDTPAFMAVGTAATVKGLTVEQIRTTGTQIVLANTYHLMLRPGAERVARLGGLHDFMGWPGPILTDSGGYQVMSLAELRKLTEQGVTFRSHVDGTAWELTPERAVEIQDQLDADITMVLDECTPYPASEREAADSMWRSMRWAERSKAVFRRRPGYALFGIVQGSVYEALRRESANNLTNIGFDGYAVGGLAVGEGQALMFSMLDATMPHLPQDRPRYLMGVGKPADLVGAVARGIDMFDCVLPTRSGRTGQAFTRRGVLNMRNARHRDDPRPLDPESPFAVSRETSRAYLHHLLRCDEMLGPILLTLHNLAYYQELMSGMQSAITGGHFADFVDAFEREQALGDLSPL